MLSFLLVTFGAAQRSPWCPPSEPYTVKKQLAGDSGGDSRLSILQTLLLSGGGCPARLPGATSKLARPVRGTEGCSLTRRTTEVQSHLPELLQHAQARITQRRLSLTLLPGLFLHLSEADLGTVFKQILLTKPDFQNFSFQTILLWCLVHKTQFT